MSGIRLAVRFRRLHDRALVDGTARRGALSSPCLRSKQKRSLKWRRTISVAPPSGRRDLSAQEPPRRRLRMLPLLITLATITIAVVARAGDVGRLYGRALDPRRHGARLCRDDGAAGRRPDRRIAGRRQPVRAQGRSADGDRPDQLQDRRQPRRSGRPAGPGQCAERRARGQAPAGADQSGGHGRGKADLCEHRAGRPSPISAGRGESGPGAGQPRAHPDPLSGQWLGDQSAGAARRLRQCRCRT